ncbi:MAG: hypothetical protein Tsb002_34670 [Wenzhouxiangellaceae bacterium]
MNYPTLIKLSAIVSLGLSPMLAQAQFELPETDIWQIALSGDNSKPQPLISRRGYDNQPHYSTGGGTLYFTQGDDEGYTDIAALDLNSGSIRTITHTPLSEFSPTPLADGRLAMVQVQQDGEQWLVAMQPDGSAPERILPATMVGYFAALPDQSWATFIVSEPSVLSYWPASASAASPTSAAQTWASDIGRTLLVAGDALYYPQADQRNVYLYRRQLTDAAPQPLMPLPEQRQDFALGPDGAIWIALDSRLYQWSDMHQRWQLWRDLRADGIQQISRLTISSDGRFMAVVTHP